MPADIHDIKARLWAAADELRANSKLKASEYSVPVLGSPSTTPNNPPPRSH